jgi:hypothetical protein
MVSFFATLFMTCLDQKEGSIQPDRYKWLLLRECKNVAATAYLRGQVYAEQERFEQETYAKHQITISRAYHVYYPTTPNLR